MTIYLYMKTLFEGSFKFYFHLEASITNKNREKNNLDIDNDQSLF